MVGAKVCFCELTCEIVLQVRGLNSGSAVDEPSLVAIPEHRRAEYDIDDTHLLRVYMADRSFRCASLPVVTTSRYSVRFPKAAQRGGAIWPSDDWAIESLSEARQARALASTRVLCRDGCGKNLQQPVLGNRSADSRLAWRVQDRVHIRGYHCCSSRVADHRQNPCSQVRHRRLACPLWVVAILSS